MLMAGKHKIMVDTAIVANGDSLAAYLTDSAGAFLTSTLLAGKQRLDVILPSNFAEDSAHTSGDYGNFVLAVRNDAGTTLAGTDGDYAPLSVDANGALYTTTTVNFSYDYAEDSAHTTGDVGAFVLGVRNDAFAAQTSADGDYGAINLDSAGRVGIRGSYAEDAAAASGDVGISNLSVRQDTLASSTSADGDYTHIKSNNLGEVYVFDTTTHTTLASILTEVSTINDVQYAEDAASASGALGNFVLGIRRDSMGTNTSATGDYSELQTWSNGELKVVDIANGSILQQQTSVTTTAAAIPTTPLANRKSIMIQNSGARDMWIGSATVTAAGATAGIRVPQGSFIELECGPAVPVFGITATLTTTANILEAA